MYLNSSVYFDISPGDRGRAAGANPRFQIPALAEALYDKDELFLPLHPYFQTEL